MMQRWKVQGNVRYTNDKGEEVSRWLPMPRALEDARFAQAMHYTNISLEVDWEGAQRVPVAVTQLTLPAGPEKPATRPKKQRPPSRPKRWAEAAAKALEGIGDLIGIQEEFESWRDNLPDNLRYGSALGDKLEEICNIDLSSAQSAIEEADGADLPLGFGRD